MDQARQLDWARKLRPLHLGVEPIGNQLRRRTGVVAVATSLLSGFMLFFLAIFAGFGHWKIGLTLDGLFVGPFLGWIWWAHLRLRQRVAR